MPRSVDHLTVAHILHRAILGNMDIQPIRLVVHGHHAIGLDHAVLLGEVLLRERLSIKLSARVPQRLDS